MSDSDISRFDRDIGWMRSIRMAVCTCEHMETSHRPISRKCSRCPCLQFTLPVKL